MSTGMFYCLNKFIRKCLEVVFLLRMYLHIIIQEWRALGVQQSRGWVHYELHRP